MTTSGTIALFLNDNLEHNLTIYFSGETYEYIFNSSISETIALACKSLDANVMWEDINVSIEGMTVILYYLSGTSWIAIQEAVSDANGLVSFVGLVMGDYRLDSTEFTLNQSTITYATDVFIEADKTVIDIDYISSITGDTIVDLSTINYFFDMQLNGVGDWYTVANTYYDGIIVDYTTGTITIYGLWHTNADGTSTFAYRLTLEDYAGVAETYFGFTIDTFNQINIEAKSLEAEFLWSADSLPVVGEGFELFFNTTSGWISLGTYVTDSNGKIILSGMLPIGVYKFDDMAEFSILATDNVKIVVSTIESLCVKEKSFSLGFYRDIESKFFFFVFKLKIMLILNPELSILDFCLLKHLTTFFYALVDSSIYLLNRGLK